MTNERKHQLLVYLKYSFDVCVTHNDGNFVTAPDNWTFYLEPELDIYVDGFEETQLAGLINIAWNHHEEQERILKLEYVIYEAGYRHVMGNDSDVALYNELCEKFGDKDYPHIMAMLYE